MIQVAIYQGRSFASEIIKLRTCWWWSNDTHVSAVEMDTMGEWEAWWGIGVREGKFGSNHKDKTPVDFFDAALTQGENDGLTEYLNSQLGKDYNYLGLVGFFQKKPVQQKNALFCSEYIFSGFDLIKKPLLARIKPWKVPPAYFRLSPLLKFNCRRYTSRKQNSSSSARPTADREASKMFDGHRFPQAGEILS